MNPNNEIMKLKGFDADTTLCELQRDQPFSDHTAGKHFGMPVSTCKFLSMLFRFWQGNQPGADNPFGDVWWVNFSKASLFRILAQEDVEYVRFYFAIPEEGINEASLALEGVKSDGSPVKLTQILAVAATMNGDDNDVDAESPGNDIMSVTAGTPPPNNEEKGNGGPPLDGNIRDISSLQEFFEKQDLDFKVEAQDGRTFKDFIAAYYLHAQQSFS